jgi:hypothetical protein
LHRDEIAQINQSFIVKGAHSHDFHVKFMNERWLVNTKKTIKAKTFCGNFAIVCDTPVEVKPEAGKRRERQADKRHGNEKLLDLS